VTQRVRAPELVGRGGWINTGGQSLTLADFKGRFLLIDHWTLCCANCLHVLDELRPLEQKFHDVLTVVGAHAPKFRHEADHEALVAACERYGVAHPVLDDPELKTWQAYGARAWPTLSLVDPEGYLIQQFSGEGHVHAVESLLTQLLPGYEARGALRRGAGLYVAPEVGDTPLRFPAKVRRLSDGSLMVADAGSHTIAQVSADGQRVLQRYGNRKRGLQDGIGEAASFNEPNGLCILPESVASKVGYDVIVADTVNHALRGINLSTQQVTTVAGNGKQWMSGDGTTALSSPWDVVWYQDRVIVAMAGIHQLWQFDPITKSLGVFAGTTNEGLVDGPLAEAWFAQTSGLAVDGERLWLVDAETSSLRSIGGGHVTTHLGSGLFDFGHRDGAANEALLQHPLGVTVMGDHSILISDTYNGALRRFDPLSGRVTTLATGLGEPSDALILNKNEVLVVESTKHSLTKVSLEASEVLGDQLRTQRPALRVRSGDVTLEIAFTPPPGQKLDFRYGSPTRLIVSATPGALLVSGEGRSEELTRTLRLDGNVGEGVLHIAAMAASCDEGGDFPTCHVHQQDWGVPIIIADDGGGIIRLPLAG